MRLRRLCLAAVASAASLLAACAAPSSAPASTSTTASAAPEVKVTMSDCEEPPLGSRVSRKCPHGQMKAGQGAAAPAETTAK